MEKKLNKKRVKKNKKPKNVLVITTIYVICFSVIAGAFAYTRINKYGSAFQHELRAFNRYDSYVCDRHADHGASDQEGSGCDSSQKAHDLRSVADCFSHVLWCHVCEQLYRSYPDTVDQYPEGKPGNQYHA